MTAELKVSFAIVAYNEEKYLPGLLEDLRAQDYPHESMEILLIDSMSTDSTRRIMDAFQRENRDFLAVLVLENPGKSIPCGHNAALDHYTGDALVRVDAHASIPADFVRKNVEVLQSGEMVCGGRRPNIIHGLSGWKQTLLAAEQSMFGSSVASYRRAERDCYAKSLFCGMYRREVYDRVGHYDERLPRTEDNDMAYRVRQAGFRLRYCPEIVFYQHARSSLRGMLRQKFLNGLWIGRTVAVQPGCLSAFHFVPLAFVLAILFTGALAWAGIAFPAVLLWSAYGLCMGAFSVMEWRKKPFFWEKLLLPVLFLLLHVGYGAGTLVGLLSLPVWLGRVKHRG